MAFRRPSFTFLMILYLNGGNDIRPSLAVAYAAASDDCLLGRRQCFYPRSINLLYLHCSVQLFTCASKYVHTIEIDIYISMVHTGASTRTK